MSKAKATKTAAKSLKDELLAIPAPHRRTWFTELANTTLKSRLIELHELVTSGDISIPAAKLHAHFRDKYGLTVKYDLFRRWLREPLNGT